MDLIYRSARLTVVCLEDIHILKEEMALVVEFYDVWDAQDVSKARKIAHEFLSALRKILSARWFSRAWCLHEHLMSRTALVLIPVHEGAVAEIELRNLLNMIGWVFSNIGLDANVYTKFVDLRNLYKRLLIKDVLGYNAGPEEPTRNSQRYSCAVSIWGLLCKQMRCLLP
jgi:hypothetical protein